MQVPPAQNDQSRYFDGLSDYAEMFTFIFKRPDQLFQAHGPIIYTYEYLRKKAFPGCSFTGK